MTYEFEAKRKIGRRGVYLDCNFDLDCFPAILIDAETETRLLLSENELRILMMEIADRLGFKVSKLPKENKDGYRDS